MQAVLWSIVLKPFIGNCHRANSRYSHCFCILGVITKYNSHVAKQINRSGNTLLQTHTKYTPFRTERTKTIPGPAAHPRIDHYKGVSLPPPPPLQVTDASVLFTVFNGHEESEIWPTIQIDTLMQAVGVVFGYILSRLTDWFHKKISYF